MRKPKHPMDRSRDAALDLISKIADRAVHLHDIGGINRHLDRENFVLTDCFSPRFSARAPSPHDEQSP